MTNTRNRVVAVGGLAVLLLAGASAFAAPFLTPTKTGVDVAAFAPTGYELEMSAEAKLNSDDLVDLVVIFVKKAGSSSEERPRGVVMLFKDAKAGYTLAGSNADLLLGFGDCGMADPDCVPDITIDGNVVSFTQFGGNRERWRKTSHFRFNPETSAFERIGYRESIIDSLTMAQEEVSIDYLTGDRLITSTPEQLDREGKHITPAPPTTTTKDKVSGPIKKLEEVGWQ